ncbi:MurR/RpiR family transcriptional regulator [Aliiroseovarius marinus]|uniref:MurR/RpiR family transcriptional regulator n=1 Tax=Aliiroseovarius marinus TaxID=2500159 RepID=UPI003D7DFC80
MSHAFEKRLTDHYGDLSETLQRAADFLRAHPVEVATRPLRQVAADCEVSPAAFSRLARALNYADFAEIRDELRQSIGRRVNNFADRAQRLQEDHADDHAGHKSGFFNAHLAACLGNLQSFSDTVDHEVLDAAVSRIGDARNVVLLGALGSTGVVEYLAYMASLCAGNWSMASRMGASLGGGLTGIDARDALIIVTKPPFAERSIRAAEMAREKGAYVVVITDTLGCPALKHASASFVVPTESPHFYSSYVVTVFLVETLIGLLVSRSGKGARDRISEVERANRILAEVWDG